MKRSKIRQMVKAIKDSKAGLFVVGSVKTGFKLAAEVAGVIVTFGYNHHDQASASRHGLAEFGIKPKRLATSKLAA